MLVLITSLFLSGCGDNQYVQDLKSYLEELKKSVAKHKKKTDITKIPAPKPVEYQPKVIRSPFETSIPTSGKGAITNPLQAFPLSTLIFKGTLSQGTIILGYVLAPDNKLYQVKLGDMIGDHYGKIIKIYPDRIEIQEAVEDASGIAMHTTQRIVTLQLKDGHG